LVSPQAVQRFAGEIASILGSMLPFMVQAPELDAHWLPPVLWVLLAV
jgi:hypothetical protein